MRSRRRDVGSLADISRTAFCCKGCPAIAEIPLGTGYVGPQDVVADELTQRVFSRTQSSQIVELDPLDGETNLIATFPREVEIFPEFGGVIAHRRMTAMTPDIANNRLLVGGVVDFGSAIPEASGVWAVNVSTGEITPLQIGGVAPRRLVFAPGTNRIYASSWDHNEVVALDAVDGTVVWRTSLANTYGVAVNDVNAEVYVLRGDPVTHRAILTILNSADGNQLDEIQLTGSGQRTVHATKDAVVIASTGSSAAGTAAVLSIFDLATRTEATVPLNGIAGALSFPVSVTIDQPANEGIVALGGVTPTVVVVDLETGSIERQFAAGDTVVGSTALPALGLLYLADHGDASISALRTDGGGLVWEAEFGSRPQGLAANEARN